MFIKHCLLVCAASSVLLAAADVSMAQEPQIRQWKAVATARPTPQFELWTWFAGELEKRTHGSVKVEVTSLAEIGFTGFEMIRAMRANLIDIADVVPGYVSGDLPILEAADLPGLYPDYETAIKAHISFLSGAKKYEERIGGVVLGGYLWPNTVIFSRKPIRGLADFKGLKIRVYGASLTDFAKALGAEPVQISLPETYTALERGTIDATFFGSYSGYALKLYEVAKYGIDVRFWPASGFLVVSKKSWDKLSPEVRGVLVKLGSEFSERAWDLGRQTTKDGIEKNKEKGVEWIATDASMEAVIRATAQKTVVPAWVRRSGPDAKQVFNQYVAPYAGFVVP